MADSASYDALTVMQILYKSSTYGSIDHIHFSLSQIVIYLIANIRYFPNNMVSDSYKSDSFLRYNETKKSLYLYINDSTIK